MACSSKRTSLVGLPDRQLADYQIVDQAGPLNPYFSNDAKFIICRLKIVKAAIFLDAKIRCAPFDHTTC